MRRGRAARRAAAGGIRGNRADAALRGARTGPRRGARPRRRAYLRGLVPGRPPGKPGARGGFRNNPRGRARHCPDAGAIARARHGAAGTARCAGPERQVRLRRHRRRHAARRSHGFRRPRTRPGRGSRARGGDSRGCAWLRPRRSGITWQWRSDGAASAGDRGGARPFARTRRISMSREITAFDIWSRRSTAARSPAGRI